MTASSRTPPIFPWKLKDPSSCSCSSPSSCLCLRKEPGGIVTVKVPTDSVTGSAGGLIPLLAVLLKVKLDSSSKLSFFGFLSRSISSAEGEEGNARLRRHDAH